MKAFTYIKQGEFGFTEKEKPTMIDAHDAIVRVTLSSICTSDLHIKHGSVPRAVPGITVGHEMVGIVEEVGNCTIARIALFYYTCTDDRTFCVTYITGNLLRLLY